MLQHGLKTQNQLQNGEKCIHDDLMLNSRENRLFGVHCQTNSGHTDKKTTPSRSATSCTHWSSYLGNLGNQPRRCLQGLRVGLECYHLLFYYLRGKIFGTPFRFPQSRHAASNRQYVQRFIFWSILAANQRK